MSDVVGNFVLVTIDRCRNVISMEIPCISWCVGFVYSIQSNTGIYLLLTVST
jgi:hypothetical protein